MSAGFMSENFATRCSGERPVASTRSGTWFHWMMSVTRRPPKPKRLTLVRLVMAIWNSSHSRLRTWIIETS